MAHIILPSRRLIQPTGAVQLRPEFESANVWLFNGDYGTDKKVTTLGSFRATIERTNVGGSIESEVVGQPGRFGYTTVSCSNFDGNGFDLAAYKSYLQPASQAAVLVVFTHRLNANAVQVFFQTHDRYNNQYGYRLDVPSNTNNLRWWTGNATWTWNLDATGVLAEGTRYVAMGMSLPIGGFKDRSVWIGGSRVAHDNSLSDFTITYSGTRSDPAVLAGRYDSGSIGLGTSPIGRVEMVAQFGSGLSYAQAESLTLDPYQIFEPQKRRLYFFGGGGAGQTVAVGQATETDTAQSISRLKAKSLGQVAETDLAQAITGRKALAIGQALETDLAQAITHAKAKLLGQATETDLAQAIAHAKTKALGQATETDLAQTITVSGNKIIAVGQVTETDTAQPLTARKAKQVGQTTETDAAQAVAHAKTKALGQAIETDLAQAITPEIPNQVGAVLETDLAQPLGVHKAKALGQVAESDVAQAVTHAKTKGLGLALEIDLGQPIALAPQRRLVAQVLETDLAQTITPALSSTQLPKGKLYTVGPRVGYRVGPRNNFRVDQ